LDERCCERDRYACDGEIQTGDTDAGRHAKWDKERTKTTGQERCTEKGREGRGEEGGTQRGGGERREDARRKKCTVSAGSGVDDTIQQDKMIDEMNNGREEVPTSSMVK
jgi:hypothetical protein